MVSTSATGAIGLADFELPIVLSKNTRLSSGGRSGDRGYPNPCVAHATNPVASFDCAETKILRFSVTYQKGGKSRLSSIRMYPD